MKLLILILFATLSLPATAAPFLLADPYPASGPQPDSASFTVNGGAPVACALESVSGGIRRSVTWPPSRQPAPTPW